MQPQAGLAWSRSTCPPEAVLRLQEEPARQEPAARLAVGSEKSWQDKSRQQGWLLVARRVGKTRAGSKAGCLSMCTRSDMREISHDFAPRLRVAGPGCRMLCKRPSHSTR